MEAVESDLITAYFSDIYATFATKITIRRNNYGKTDKRNPDTVQ